MMVQYVRRGANVVMANAVSIKREVLKEIKCFLYGFNYVFLLLVPYCETQGLQSCMCDIIQDACKRYLV